MKLTGMDVDSPGASTVGDASTSSHAVLSHDKSKLMSVRSSFDTTSTVCATQSPVSVGRFRAYSESPRREFRGRSLTRPFRDTRRFPFTRVYPVPGAKRTPRKCGFCPSFKGHFLSPRANLSGPIRYLFIAAGRKKCTTAPGICPCRWSRESTARSRSCKS